MLLCFVLAKQNHDIMVIPVDSCASFPWFWLFILLPGFWSGSTSLLKIYVALDVPVKSINIFTHTCRKWKWLRQFRILTLKYAPKLPKIRSQKPRLRSWNLNYAPKNQDYAPDNLNYAPKNQDYALRKIFPAIELPNCQLSTRMVMDEH